MSLSEIRVNTLKTRTGVGTITYTETGPIIAGIVTSTGLDVNGNGDISGNLSVGGVLTYEDVTNIDSVGIITARGGITNSGGNISLADRPDGSNHNLFFGTGAKAGIYHDGTNFTLINNTGHTYIGIGAANKDLMLYTQSTGSIILQRNTGHKYFEGVGSDGTAIVYFNTNEKLRTTNTGVSITGIPVATQNTGNIGLDLHATGSGRGSQTKYHNDHGEAYVGTAGDTTGNLLIHNTSNTDMLFATNNLERLRIESDGDVNIGAAADNTAIHASGLFNAATPKLEIKLGGASNSYTRLINITNPGAQTGSETLGRVGIKLSLGSEASSGESNKSGIIYAESTSAYNNGPSLCFATNNNERLRITSSGHVNIGTSQLDQTDRMLNVYGGRMRISGIPNNSNSFEIYASATTGQSHGILCQAGTNSSDINSTFRNTSGTTLFRIRGDGNIGIANGSPFNRFCVGGHTFSGGHGMYNDSRVGMSNHGNLTGLMLASTYNDANHPEYGLVFVQGPTTSSYNVWSISPDGPAKGNSLNLHYGAQNTNIHGPTNQKFEFTGEGYLLKPKHPSFCARRSTAGDGRAAASPITEWSTSTSAPCHNIGGHFNASTGKFTAPVAGIYHFSACPGYKQSGNNYNFKFRIDNSDEFEPVRFIDGGDDLTSHSTGTGSITVYMTANQTMSVHIAYTHHVNTTYNFFSGHLIG